MLGSYYQANYYRNPVPYTSSDIGAPVPGWGANLKIAGPTRLGVSGVGFGQTIKTSAIPKALETMQQIRAGTAPMTSAAVTTTAAPAVTVGGLPWWAWPVIAAVGLGGLGYYGTKKGWF
jgi:hypothetical protein